MIKSKKFSILIACLILTGTAFSQQKDIVKQVAESASPEVKKFHERLSKAETGNEADSMIFSLGKIGNKNFIPYLKALLKQGHCGRCIEVVLVQLGETSYVKKAIADVDSRFDPICNSPKRTNNDRYKCHDTNSTQDNAIWKLARFKTREAYQKLYELLDDKTNRNFEAVSDSAYLTRSWHTINQLCNTIENPPLEKRGIKTRCASKPAIWKAWFETS